jgi:hypothetical protein
MKMKASGWRVGFATLGLFLLVALWTNPAEAYAWMIRHDYTGCNQCHADPAGGGLLTAYGRAQSDFLLRMRYGAAESWEAPPSSQFLFGAVKLPESVLLGGDVRFINIASKANGVWADLRSFFMQADLTGQVTRDRFRVNGSIGFAQEGALEAAITHRDEGNLVSRVHWVGYDLGEDKNWTLRAGRMNLPFGIRTVEHTMWVRQATRTDINKQQQHGVALAYNGTNLRGELMLIGGNLQLAPDAFRERGYSGFLEYTTSPRVAFGVSSLVAYAQKRPPGAPASNLRHAHGAFVRYNPAKPLVLMAEADFLANPGIGRPAGYVAMAQADFELTQGFHLIATGELLKDPVSTGLAKEGWGSLVWFFLPHMNVRADVIVQSRPNTDVLMLLGQLHAFL